MKLFILVLKTVIIFWLLLLGTYNITAGTVNMTDFVVVWVVGLLFVYTDILNALAMYAKGDKDGRH